MAPEYQTIQDYFYCEHHARPFPWPPRIEIEIGIGIGIVDPHRHLYWAQSLQHLAESL